MSSDTLDSIVSTFECKIREYIEHNKTNDSSSFSFKNILGSFFPSTKSSSSGVGYGGGFYDSLKGSIFSRKSHHCQQKDDYLFLLAKDFFIQILPTLEPTSSSDASLNKLKDSKEFKYIVIMLLKGSSSLEELIHRKEVYKELFCLLYVICNHVNLKSFIFATNESKNESIIHLIDSLYQQLVTYKKVSRHEHSIDVYLSFIVEKCNYITTEYYHETKSEMLVKSSTGYSDIENGKVDTLGAQQDSSIVKKTANNNSHDNSVSRSSSQSVAIHIKSEPLNNDESFEYTASLEELQSYETIMKPHCFSLVSIVDDVSQNKAQYIYHQETVQAQLNSVIPHPKERMSRIAREISELQNNLPIQFSASIFVRCDENRYDILKALIIAPDNTPYANGCFEFDLFLPLDYPDSPPKVSLVTTGKGQIRFNPNLYADGKVCLSLLGTWHGPGWDPGSSTILQVLVSIQSLIFVSDPYFNEPGYQMFINTKEGRESSASYNGTIREATLQEALFNQMLYPSRFFEQVISTHFRIKSGYIIQQLAHWKLLCQNTWSLSRSGSDYLDSFVGVKDSLTIRGNAFNKLIETTSKRLNKFLTKGP